MSALQIDFKQRAWSRWAVFSLAGLLICALGAANLTAQTAGLVDTNYNVGGTGADGTVYSLTLQADGKLLVGGEFTTFNLEPLPRLARLLTNGILDPVFSSGIDDGAVFASAVQSNGKIVIGGSFTSIGAPLPYLARLEPVGTVDGAFASVADGTVYAVAIYSGGPDNGKILIGGLFTMLTDQFTFISTPRPFIARLNSDGTLDPSFNPDVPDGTIYGLVIQPDGKVLIAGGFFSISGTPRGGVARLNSDGTLDTTFDPGIGADSAVFALARQSDGKVLIGGSFTDVNGSPRNYVARLLTNGVVDATFLTTGGGLSGPDDYVTALLALNGGKVLIGGGFTDVNGLNRNHLARLNADGSTDLTINIGAGANNFLAALAVQTDNKILLGGGFTSFDGLPLNYLARLAGGTNAGSGKFAFASSSFAVNENGGLAIVTVRRLEGLSNTVTVRYTATNDTAPANLRYTPVSDTLTFLPGEDRKEFTVTINDDQLVNGDTNVSLTLSDPVGAVLGTPATATLTIIDNDSQFSFELSNYLVNENVVTAVITVVRNGGSTEAASVDYLTRNGSAAAPADYFAAQGRLYFGVGETVTNFSVTIVDDVLSGEGNETVFLSLTNALPASAASLGTRSNTTLLIVDNDLGPGELEFALDTYSFLESIGTANISVIRKNGRSGIVSIGYATANGGAISGQDYTGKTNTLSFADGQTNKNITIAISNDALIETNEPFFLRLFTPTGGATLGSRSNATARIIDDDFLASDPGRLEFDLPVFTVGEGDGLATITVRRNGGTNGPVSVNFATGDGSAVAPFDFTPTNGVLAFAGGEMAKTFQVSIVNDFASEGNESLIVRLFNAVGAPLGTTNTAALTILENDLNPGGLIFASTNLTVEEGDFQVCVTIVRVGGLTGPISVDFQTRNGTATNGTAALSPVEYFGFTNTLLFADGQASTNVCVTVIDNFTTNANKNFTLHLVNSSSPVGVSPTTASVAILDDEYIDGDRGVVSFGVPTYTVNERGVFANISVVRRVGRTGTVNVNYTTINGTARRGTNYLDTGAALTNTVRFDDDEVLKFIRIQIIDDALLNADRFLTLRLETNGVANAAGLDSQRRTATLTIQDDDARYGDLHFAAYDYSVGEEMGLATITVRRDNGNFGTLSVDYLTSDYGAVDGVDYTNSSGTLTFFNGQTLATFSIPIANDAVANAGLRQVYLTLTNLQMAPTPTNFQGPATISRDLAVLTIYDDEAYLTPAGSAGEFNFTFGGYNLINNGFFNNGFYQADREGYRYYYYDEGAYDYGCGALITVTRTNNSRGRVMVDYEVYDPLAPNNYNNNGYCGNGITSNRGTLIFDDFQMSTNFYVNYRPISYFYSLNCGYSNVNQTLNLTLSNPRGVPGEPTPRLGSNHMSTLTVYSTSQGFNFGSAFYRVPEWFGDTRLGPGIVRLEVYRECLTVNAAVTVNWEVLLGRGVAGSDYANDYDNPNDTSGPFSGSLTWAANDYQPKIISIGLVQDGLVEFNEDFYVRLTIPDNVRGNPGETLGQISSTTVTILFDDANRRLDQTTGTGTSGGGVAPVQYRNEQPAGAADLTWNRDRSGYVAPPNPPFNDAPGANNHVYALAVQPDGKVILGGEFTGYNSFARNRIASADIVGGLDTEFDPGTGADAYIGALALYTFGANSGKIVIGGGFTSFNGQSRYGVARLNTNGSLDAAFIPGSGANGAVRAMAVQYDGKVIIGGDFTLFDGTNRNHIARLNVNGSLDTTFNPGLGADGPVYAVALSGPAPIAVASAAGGGSAGGTDTNLVNLGFNSGTLLLDAAFLARTNSLKIYQGTTLLLSNDFAGNRSFSIAFGPAFGTGVATNLTIVVNEDQNNNSNNWSYAGTIIPSGSQQVLIGGSFATVNGTPRGSVARLNSNGSLDPAFNTGSGVNGVVYALAVNGNALDTNFNKVTMGGDFTSVNLRPRGGIARLNTDGRVDASFDPGAGFNDLVYSVALQPDGKPLVGGLFTAFDGTRRIGVARLLATGALDTSFMDTAYNHFAGVPNQESFAAPNFISAVAYQREGGSDYVFIGGSFTRVGGGYTRDEVRFRSNIARLVGGTTPGPGNMEFTVDGYGADESGSFANVSVRRVNGTLGSVAADLVTRDLTAVAPADYSNVVSKVSWSYHDATTYVHKLPINDDPAIEGNEAFSVTLTNPVSTFFLPDNYSFYYLSGVPIPVGAALGRSIATVTVLDDDFTPGVLGFTAPAYTVNENGVTATITVTRTNGSTGVVTVNYATSDLPSGPGSATANTDYTPRGGTLSFSSGETNKTFTIPITDDTGVEDDEALSLQLTVPTGGATLGLASATLSIVDNDFLPGRLKFATTNYVASESASFATVLVSRSGGNLGAISVQAVASDGTATNGLDYTAVTNTLNWADGDTANKSFTVPIINDGKVDPGETINLHLVNPSVVGALVGGTNATVTILDDDFYGNFSFSTLTYTANENGSHATITVVRTNGIAETVTVNFGTSDGTTNSSGAYAPTTGMLTFTNGETVKSFAIALTNNALSDGTKFVVLTLSNALPVGAGLTFPSQASLAIIDDESANVPAGSVDTAFNPDPGADGPVYALALQLNGSLVIGGDFDFVNGAVRNSVARLHANGTLDGNFNPGLGPNAAIRSLALHADGKLLIGGFFTSVNGVPRNYIARLTTGGTVDTSFNPGSGLDNPVYALVIQRTNNQEKIVVGGGFTSVNGVSRNYVARLNADGTLDPTFNPGLGANDAVFAVALQNDGKVLIGGDFTMVNNTNRGHIARLNADGSLDLSFNPSTGANASVRALAVQSDGKIVLGGLFTDVNGTNWNHVARLNSDGSLDPTFNPGVGADNLVYTLALQDDGKIVLGGDFSKVNGVTRNRITRLNADGTADPTINFGTGANSFVAALAVQPDGKFIIGGGFTTVNDVPRNHIARLHGGALSGAGALEFASSDYSVTESGVNSVITVRRTGGTAGTVTVRYATSPGTATLGDYTDTSGTLTFPEGEVKQTFTVAVQNDQLVNSNRTVNLALSDFTGATPGPQPTATLTIENDDSLVGYQTATFSVNENAVGGRAVITVARTGSSLGTVVVNFASVAGGSATAGADYTSVNSSLIFAPGETVKSFTVSIVADAAVEGNETVNLALSSPSGSAVLGQSTATLVIVDNDFASGRLVFSSASYTVNEDAPSVIVTVVRTNGSSGIVSAQYATSDGTATSGFDYSGASGTVAFADGQTSNTFTVPILLDDQVETNETVNLRLFAATGGATIGTLSNAVLLITNIGGVPVPGSLDPNFNPGTGANNLVRTLAIQPDGKIVIGGAFTNFNGAARNFLCRLQTNGLVDDVGFDPGVGPNGLVSAVAVQPDGRVLLGGAFQKVDNIARLRVSRQDTNGVVDFSFSPYGIDAIVYAIAPHNGGVVLGGLFNSTPSVGIARFLANGTNDFAFNAGSGVNGAVYALAVQPDHKIILGGSFTTVNGRASRGLARLNADGSVDTNFVVGAGVNGIVFALALQSGGKIMIGGEFTMVGAVSRTRVARLEATGAVDLSFNAGTGINDIVYALAIQADNKVVIGGDFTLVNGVSRNRVARLTEAGPLDNTFTIGGGADSTVYAVGLQPDGKAVIGGDFVMFNGELRNGIARLSVEATAPVPPFDLELFRFASITYLPGGEAVLVLNVQAGYGYVLEGSPVLTTNTASWTPLVTNSPGGATLTFTNNPSPNLIRFYRARRTSP